MVRVGDLPIFAILVVIAGVVVSVGAQITANISTTQTAGSVARLAIDNATTGLGNLAAQFPVIGTVIGLAVLIGILFGLFSGVFRGRGGE